MRLRGHSEIQGMSSKRIGVKNIGMKGEGWVIVVVKKWQSG